MNLSPPSHSPHRIHRATPSFPGDLAPLWDLAIELAGKTSAVFATLATTVTQLTQSQADLHFHVGALPHAIDDDDHVLPVADGVYRYGTLAVHPHPRQVTQPALPLAHAQVLATAAGQVMHVLEGALYLRYRQRAATSAVFAPLTAREREVLTYLYQRYTKLEIANAMQIAPRTVETHQKHLYKKLGVHRESEAILVGLDAGYFVYLA